MTNMFLDDTKPPCCRKCSISSEGSGFCSKGSFCNDPQIGSYLFWQVFECFNICSNQRPATITTCRRLRLIAAKVHNLELQSQQESHPVQVSSKRILPIASAIHHSIYIFIKGWNKNAHIRESQHYPIVLNRVMCWPITPYP